MMRILIDTNVLFSALLFPDSKPAQALYRVASRHKAVLCDRNIWELREILARKAPRLLPDAEIFLAEFSYELIPAVDHAEKLIRDAKDMPILNAAIVYDVDLILTGNKDFFPLISIIHAVLPLPNFWRKRARTSESFVNWRSLAWLYECVAEYAVLFQSIAL